MEDILDQSNEKNSFDIKNKKMKEGNVLIQPAKNCKEFFLLEEGSVEILKSDLDVLTNSPPKVLENSVRISVVEGESVFGEAQVILDSQEPLIVRALEDCKYKVVEVKNKLLNFLKENVPIGFEIVEALIKRNSESLSFLEEIDALITKTQIISDNTAIAMAMVDPELGSGNNALSNGNDNGNSNGNPLRTYANKLFSQYDQAQEFSNNINEDFFTNDDIAKVLKKTYGVKDKNFVGQGDGDVKDMFKKLLSVEGPLLHQLMDVEPGLLESMCQILSNSLEKLNNKAIYLTKLLDKLFTTLVGKQKSWISEFIDVYERLKQDSSYDINIIQSAIQHLVENIEKINNEYFGLYGKEYPVVSSKFKAFSSKFEKEAQAKAHEKRRKVREEEIVFPAELENSLDQILEYSELPEEDIARFLKEYKRFKRLRNRFDTSLEFARIRKRLTLIYWKIYERTYLKYKKTEAMPKASEMLLRYGYLDEDLCTDEDVFDLYNLTDKTSDEYPIHHIIEWLDGVYNKDIYPSISEFGETFRQLRKRELGRDYDPEEEQLYTSEMYELRSKFEIQNSMKLASIICSGNPRAAFPIFCSEVLVRGDVTSSYVTKKKLAEAVRKVLDVDFSAFSREITFKSSSKHIEFPKKSVIPNFIILPVLGSRIQLWQAMEGTNKSTCGRIMVPAFLCEDLEDAVVRAVGGYRYELSKELAGSNWMHPVDGGLAGAYYDYMAYFKKNPKLSMEAKEKIDGDFKRFRTTRDRFINDYYYWIKYEKDGILRLNKVTREILYKHVPFKREIRDKLSTFPAYEEIHTRFTNVARRTITTLKNRYHRAINRK